LRTVRSQTQKLIHKITMTEGYAEVVQNDKTQITQLQAQLTARSGQ